MSTPKKTPKKAPEPYKAENDYQLDKAVRGEHRVAGEVVRVSYKAGVVTPKNAAEELALKKLVGLKLATVAGAEPVAEPEKKEQ